MAGPGRPGRVAASAAGFPAPDSSPASPGFAGRLRTRPKPPDDLCPEAKAVFVEVVTNSREGHFQAVDVPLLAVYCEAIVQARAAAKIIREGGGSDLVVKQQHNALSACFQLSMRLRISPQARQPHVSRGSNTRPPSVNYYDRLQLEMGSDEEA
jgi:hypothetical protein